MGLEETIYEIADELRGLASSGLYFSDDPYDRERYEKALALSARLISVIEERSPGELLSHFEDTLLHLSPLIGASTVVQEDEKILLIQRSDNGLWALPGGLVEVGEVLAKAALRELEEEAGVTGHALDLLAIFDSKLWRTFTTSHLTHFVFLVRSDLLDPSPGREALDARFFSMHELPPIDPGQVKRLPIVLKVLAGEIPKPYFDHRLGCEHLIASDEA